MKLGIMQPYFVPYIGYWQLIHAVDEYVVYDDVNYIKGGWINRNRILVNGSAKYLSLELQGASPNKLIKEISLTNNSKHISKLLKTIDQSYRKAPMFEEVFPLVEAILTQEEKNLAQFLYYSIARFCSYMNIETKIHLSSDIGKDGMLRGQEKVIDICKKMQADTYINAIGGIELYSSKSFRDSGIELLFLRPSMELQYKQFGDAFVPNLSIIDVLMFTPRERIPSMLESYDLIGSSNDG